MNELQRNLIANGVGAPPSHVLEAIDDALAHRRIAGAPHSIYEEIWHLAFWMELSLDWITRKLTPYPEHASDGFAATAMEPWTALKDRFLRGAEDAARVAGDTTLLDTVVTCPSRESDPERSMSVRDQVAGIATHNAYHLGRVVLLRQLCGSWPPPSGGDTW